MVELLQCAAVQPHDEVIHLVAAVVWGHWPHEVRHGVHWQDSILVEVWVEEAKVHLGDDVLVSTV